MRNLLAFLAFLVIAFLGLGWYLGWYSFRTVPADAGHRGYTIDINAQKIETDVQKGVRSGEQELHDVLQNAKSTAATPAATDPKTPAPGSGAINGLRRLLSDKPGQSEPATIPAKPSN
jgi:hypothetical protein